MALLKKFLLTCAVVCPLAGAASTCGNGGTCAAEDETSLMQVKQIVKHAHEQATENQEEQQPRTLDSNPKTHAHQGAEEVSEGAKIEALPAVLKEAGEEDLAAIHKARQERAKAGGGKLASKSEDDAVTENKGETNQKAEDTPIKMAGKSAAKATTATEAPTAKKEKEDKAELKKVDEKIKKDEAQLKKDGDEDDDDDDDDKKNKTDGNKTKGEEGEEKAVGWVWPWSGWTWDSNKSVFSNVYHSWDIYIVSTLISFIIWIILALLVWNCCFPANPEIFSDPLDPVETFEHNHWICLKRQHICLCSAFCPAVQWADTMHLSGFLKASSGLSLFFICALLNGLCGGFFAMGAFTSLLIIFYRQKLREKLHLKSWTASTCFFDCLFVCCCPCCAIAQEAQVVRYAYQQGVGSRAAPRAAGTNTYIQRGGTSPVRSSNSVPRVISTGPTSQVPRPVATSGSSIYTRSLSPEPGRSSYVR